MVGAPARAPPHLCLQNESGKTEGHYGEKETERCGSLGHGGGHCCRRAGGECPDRATFAGDWHVDAIDPVTMEVTVRPEGIQAWLATLTRV